MTDADPEEVTGEVVPDGDHASLVFRRRLDHSPGEVWKARTDPDELSTWYLTQASIDGRPGGTIDFVAGPYRFHVTGRILAWDPPRVFEHEWKVAPGAGLREAKTRSPAGNSGRTGRGRSSFGPTATCGFRRPAASHRVCTRSSTVSPLACRINRCRTGRNG